MRHRRHSSKLNRTSEHRGALMRNLAAALIENGRIKTTLAKAKQLRPFIEMLVTKAKHGNAASVPGDATHNRRLVFSYLHDKFATHSLFTEVAPRFAERPGGYTRVVKAGFRAGDSAPMAYIEFLDAEQAQAETAGEEKSAIRRGIDKARKSAAK